MKKLIYLVVFLLGCNALFSQSGSNMESVAVIQIDSKGFTMDPMQMGDLVRMELDKLNKFQMIDKYDMLYLIDQNKLDINNCLGRLCAVEIGKSLKVDKMLTGSIENLGEMIVVNLKLIDVATSDVEKSEIVEFISNKNQIINMIGMTLQKMFDIEIDEDQFSKLTKPYDYENLVNTPSARKLNLSGPRMGIVVFSGDMAEVYKAPKSEGGLDAIPVMFQFGYQFEVSYINEGNFQALFEFIPLLTGLDQGLVIPSISLLNGLRSSRNGFEFAFGPTLSIAKKAEGYFDAAGEWHLRNEWKASNGDEPNPFPLEERLDSRGNPAAFTGFVFVVGKTFKSGRLNIPVNAFFIPGKDASHRFGISVGFNAKR